jgi:SSS family solute:Na+ symporter
MVYAIVVAYLGILLGVGFYASKRIKTGEDFMLAGRGLGPILIAGTLAATEVGGGSSMGVAQQAFGDWGLSAGWYVLTMAIVFVILAFLAPKLRSTRLTTVPEFFARKYGKANHILTTVILLLPMIGLTAIQIMASGIVLSIMLGIEFKIAVLVMGAVAVTYSVVGGLWSVTLTDMIQWICVIGGIIITVPFALKAVGGWSVVTSSLEPWRFSLTGGIGWKTIIGLTVMYLASFTVGQEYMQRYFAAKDDRSAKLGSLGAAATYVLFAFFPAILGLIALTFQRQGLQIPYVAEYGTRYVLPGLATCVLPAPLLGLLFAALVSATMSSADSDLVAAGTLFANDIYKPYINPRASPDRMRKVLRVFTAIMGVVSILVAMYKISIIVTILIFSFSLRAGGIFVPYLLSHYWSRGSKIGTFLAIMAGSTLIILDHFHVISFWGWNIIIPALMVSLVVFVLSSCLCKDRN